MRRSLQQGMSPLRAGLIALVLIAVGTYFAFSKDLPFTRGYQIQAVFENSNLVQKRSPVRIAGVDVGEVVAVERYRNTRYSLVTMEIDDRGRPVHNDATIKIRPRLFLEGNFYLDLRPGAARGEELPDGGLIPVAQTSRPVQLDQVLTALQSDTRASLKKLLRGFGATLGSEPTAADDADQDPEVRGLTGGQALNRSLGHSADALRDSAIVSEALQGEAPRDLTRLIRGLARTSSALARDERALGGLIEDFNTTVAATASKAPELTETIRLLGPTAANARRGFGSIARALPPTREFARELTPGVAELPATIAAALPWLDQTEPLLGDAELGGLLAELTPASRDLAALAQATREFLPRIDEFNRCVTEVILPTGNVRVDDGPLSAGVENYKEFWHAMVGQAGEGQSFDGNGPFLRLATGGGGDTIQTGRTNYGNETLFANVVSPPLRTRPAFPGTLPPLRRDVPCHRNPVPDVNGPASVGPADGSRPNAPAPAVPPLGSASAAALVPVRELDLETGR